jgi:hypothetical protein
MMILPQVCNRTRRFLQVLLWMQLLEFTAISFKFCCSCNHGFNWHIRLLVALPNHLLALWSLIHLSSGSSLAGIEDCHSIDQYYYYRIMCRTSELDFHVCSQFLVKSTKNSEVFVNHEKKFFFIAKNDFLLVKIAVNGRTSVFFLQRFYCLAK